jgi:hypothetical protein
MAGEACHARSRVPGRAPLGHQSMRAFRMAGNARFAIIRSREERSRKKDAQDCVKNKNRKNLPTHSAPLFFAIISRKNDLDFTATKFYILDK